MPETAMPQETTTGETTLSERDRRLAEAGVRIPSGTPRPLRAPVRKRPRWLAALIRLFS